MIHLMHLDQERRQRLLHGELSPPDAEAARRHLATCEACRDCIEREERDERESLELLAALDDAPPHVTPAQVATAARGGASPWGRWAAGLALTLGVAGAAYALPGAPVRPWVEQLLGPAQARPRPEAPVQPTSQPPTPEVGPASGPAGTPPETAAAGAGLMVEPGQDLLILFSSPQTGGSVRVVLGDGELVEAVALDGPASFTSDIDRLVIANADSDGSFEIRIPLNAPRVEIRVGERSVFLKDGQRITAASAGSAGAWTIPLSIGRDAR